MARRYDQSTTTFSPEGNLFFHCLPLTDDETVTHMLASTPDFSFPLHRLHEIDTTRLSIRIILYITLLGRLHQVEYAIEAINNAGTCVGTSTSNASFDFLIYHILF